MEADKDRDGKISFEEFTKMVENTDVSMSMTLGEYPMVTFPMLREYVLTVMHRSILDCTFNHITLQFMALIIVPHAVATFRCPFKASFKCSRLVSAQTHVSVSVLLRILLPSPARSLLNISILLGHTLLTENSRPSQLGAP